MPAIEGINQNFKDLQLLAYVCLHRTLLTHQTSLVNIVMEVKMQILELVWHQELYNSRLEDEDLKEILRSLLLKVSLHYM